MQKAKKGILALLLIAFISILSGQGAWAQPADQTQKQNTLPAGWRSPAAPDYFWDAMEKIVAQGYVPDMIEEWTVTYGQNRSDWPLEYQALDSLWMIDESYALLPDTCLLGCQARMILRRARPLILPGRDFWKKTMGRIVQK